MQKTTIKLSERLSLSHRAFFAEAECIIRSWFEGRFVSRVRQMGFEMFQSLFFPSRRYYGHPGLDPGSQINTVLPATEPESFCGIRSRIGVRDDSKIKNPRIGVRDDKIE